MDEKKKEMGVPLDDAWFEKRREEYLHSEEFSEVERIAGIKLEDLASKNPETQKLAQDKFIKKSVLLNEIRASHFGYGFPFLIYTHEFGFFDKVPEHESKLDELFLGLDMCDSLRRRHVALSHAILPDQINELREINKRPIIIKNLGSGVGLDMINAAKNTNGNIEKVLNYDITTKATNLGERITEYCEKQKILNPGVTKYIPENLTSSKEEGDLIVLIGIICGLNDRYARILLSQAKRSLKNDGKLIVSSSNYHMRDTDPLSNFMIQKIGSNSDVSKGWSLNFRTRDQMEDLLKSAGFNEINIYDDANYPCRRFIPEDILYGVDCLPSISTGLKEKDYKPMNLPSKEIVEQKIGYNWIAIAKK
jgi:hypothetical protein